MPEKEYRKRYGNKNSKNGLFRVSNVVEEEVA